MATVIRSIRNSPHFVNSILVVAAVVPVVLYANMRSPSQEQVQEALVSSFRCGRME
jgi:hypothetical protein